MTPILHWNTFTQTVDGLYRPGNPLRVSQAFMSVLFAVLTLGRLFTAENDQTRAYSATQLLETTRTLIDPWSNEYELDHARTLVLITIALNELNLKSAAWSWLGGAVRVAQDLGLHTEPATASFIEGELRRRTWWTVYILDRSLAIELGRPMLINDSDCDVSLPAAVDDCHFSDRGPRIPDGVEPLTHTLLAVIHVVRSYTSLGRALASPVIAPTRLATFDQHFASCRRTFPAFCDPTSAATLAPPLLNPLIYLLHARLLLHRHNLLPSCPPDVRHTAIEQCTHTALDTAALLARTSPAIVEGATALLATHTFRCALFLLLTGCFEQASDCIRALAAISNHRDVVVPCGRYLAFFVSALASRRADIVAYLSQVPSPGQPPSPYGQPPPPQRPSQAAVHDALLRDEELLAYVSSDLQAGTDTAWVWAGSSEREAQSSLAPAPSPVSVGGAKHSLFSTEARSGLSSEERWDWGPGPAGWERLENSMRRLAAGEMASTTTPTTAPPGAHPPPKQGQHTPAQAWAAASGGPPPPPALPPVLPPHGGVKIEMAPISIKMEMGGGGGGPDVRMDMAGLPPMTTGSRPPQGCSSGSPTAGSGAKSKSQERISIANII
jgi:hypothetical protein